MIDKYYRIELELLVKNGFEIEREDNDTSKIIGVFDKEEVKEAVKEQDWDPEDLCETKTLEAWAEEWARDNGWGKIDEMDET